MTGKYKKGLVSVVVPAYNHENYVVECIDSIINQTYQNIELIIVNDGSKDKTKEAIESKIKECEERFVRFIFIDKENEGIVKTLNKGLDLAEGEFVAACASDDKYVHTAFETLYDFLSKNDDFVLAVGDNYIMDNDSMQCYWNKERKNVYNENEARYQTHADLLKKIRKDIDFNSPDFGTYASFIKGNYVPNGYLIRSSIFLDKIGGYSDRRPLEDYYLMLQLSKHGKLKYVDTPLFYYRWHDTNTSKNAEKMANYTAQTILPERYYAYKNGYMKEFNKQTKNAFFEIPNIYKYEIIKEWGRKTTLIDIFGVNVFKKVSFSDNKKKKIRIFNIPIS